MGEVEKGKEQKETNESTKDEEAADSFVNEIYTSERKQEPCDEEKADETLPGNDDTNKQPSDGNAEVGKGPEQEEYTNLQGHKSTEVRPENNVDECRETRSGDALNRESHSEPEDEEEDEVKPGVLTVHVIEASNLLNKDIMGKSDPYVEILFEETKVKSNTVNNSLSPQWNFISNFDVSGDDTSNIKFSVFDADYGKDQLLGSCSISIKDALSELDSARWISLEGPESGKISIKFGFTEKPDPNEEKDEEETKEERAADSFVNDVSEAEGRQEPTVESEKEEEQEETKEDSKENKAADSFVNEVSEEEGRQEPTVEPEQEEEQEETKEDSKEDKAADSFVN